MSKIKVQFSISFRFHSLKIWSMKFSFFKSYLDSTPHMLTLFSLGILLFSGLLCYEFRRSSHAGANEIIGYVSYKNKAVKRKADSTVVWDEVEQKLPIARRDTIQTSTSSDTVITLKDGTELKIAENSLVLLDFTENKMNLDFKYGSIQTSRNGKGNDSLIIQSDGVKINLVDGDLFLDKKENSDLTISSTRGNASIQKGLNSISLKENSEVVMKNKDLPVIREIEIRLLSPESQKIFTIKEKAKTKDISFYWSTKFLQSKIQISTDSSFAKLIVDGKLTTTEYVKKLAIGSYYWRVLNFNSANQTESEIRKFYVGEEIPFQFKYPLLNSEYILNKKSVFVNFAWDKVDGIQSYLLEISKSENFNNIEKKFTVISQSFGVELEEEGKYFFRLKTLSNNPEFPEKLTDVGNFSVKKKDSSKAPILMNPKNGISLEENSKILLGWKRDPFYHSFAVIISENSEFTKNIRKIKTKENYAQVDKLEKPKTYYWRVEGYGEESKLLATSVFHLFRIEEKNPSKTLSLNLTTSRELEVENTKSEEPPYIVPTLAEPSDNIVQEVNESGTMKFSWKKQSLDIGYRFYLYKQKDFTEELILKKETIKDQLQVQNQNFKESGKFYWLVESKYKKEEKIFFAKSKKRTFKLISKLLPPKIKKSEEVYYINEK
jgi:hypothetical protein